MSWTEIAKLALQYGLPVAYQIWNNITTGKDPTQAEWDALLSLANQSAKDRMSLALVRAGIDPASDAGKILLTAVV